MSSTTDAAAASAAETSSSTITTTTDNNKKEEEVQDFKFPLPNDMYLELLSEDHKAVLEGNFPTKYNATTTLRCKNGPTLKGVTPVQLAAVVGRADIIEKLLTAPHQPKNASSDNDNKKELEVDEDEEEEEEDDEEEENDDEDEDEEAQESKKKKKKKAKKEEKSEKEKEKETTSTSTTTKEPLDENGFYYEALEKICSPNRTLTEFACRTKQGSSVLKVLCRAGDSAGLCKVNEENGVKGYSVPPAYLCCYYGFLDSLKILHKEGNANLSWTMQEDGETLLHVAAKKGNVEVLEYLLEHRAVDPNVARMKDGDGRATAFALACAHGHLKCVEVLFAANGHESALKEATDRPKLNVRKLKEDEDKHEFHDPETHRVFSKRRGFPPIPEDFSLDVSSSSSYNTSTSSPTPAERQHKMYEEKEQHQQEVEESNNNNNDDHHNNNIDGEEDAATATATSSSKKSKHHQHHTTSTSKEEKEKERSYVMTLDRKRTSANAPLHRAVWNNHLDVVKFLCENGFACDVSVIAGRVHPCYAAAVSGDKHLHILKYLVEERGADPSQPLTQDNATAVMSAAYYQHIETLRYLLKKGVSTNILYKNLSTPFAAAISNGSLQSVKILVESRQADITSPHGQQSPLEYARSLKRQEIVKYLESQGCY